MCWVAGFVAACELSPHMFWETHVYNDKGEFAKDLKDAKATIANALDHEEGVAEAHYAKGKARTPFG